MPFVKLDCGILNSTLWFEREAREVFITALLMAEPIELTEPMPQIAVGSLDFTGWSVPPGWYGFVPAASVGILHQAQVSPDVGMPALTRLGEPEQTSRSKEFDGRRLVRVDGGFIVLNFMRYRDRDYTAAVRSARYRKRKLDKEQLASQRDVTASHRNITQAEAEAEAEGRGQKQIVDPINKLDTEVVASTKGRNGAKNAPPAAAKPRNGHDTRSKRPIFSGQRLTVFEWFLDKAEQTLGTELLNGFDIHEWFFTLDTAMAKANIVIPQRDNGAWLTEQLLTEAARRGLPIAVMPDGKDKTAGNAEALQRFLDRHS